jgi:hypothetical protein
MKPFGTVFALAVSITSITACAQNSWVEHVDDLTFQTHSMWSPRLNLSASTVMVYGIDATLPQRIESWRTHGYHVAVMTGVSWGEYQDYLDGRYDGKKHWDEAQTDANGHQVLHGKSQTIPYIAPSATYGEYLASGVRRALDAGAESIYLEEPEFWAKSGWSESFRREWQSYYKEPWQAPDSSPDAQYRASKLKYFLYRRALSQVFSAVKDYGTHHGRTVPCYVATHSLLNYAQWRIVSPESSLIDVGTSGYIAQVWTGTARTPNMYQGETRERTFETAFLEYGAMQNLVRASGRRVWYLNDPIEDNPNHSWHDYISNWESTLTASLLQAEVASYEVIPWPERVFGPHSVYPVSENSGERVLISKAYETELQTVFHALAEMHQSKAETRWESAGTQGIGVLVSDTMMFQRAPPEPSDARLSSFYGLALPLLMHGIPVEPVQIESAAAPGFLSRYKALLLTYEGQTPPSVNLHHALAAWVRDGGALTVVDDDQSPYLKVREWWNNGSNHYATPREELFAELGLPANAIGLQHVGKGVVVCASFSPAALAAKPDGAETVRKAIQSALEAAGTRWTTSSDLILRRGEYVVVAGLENEVLPNSRTPALQGYFLNLFDADLPVLQTVSPMSGTHMLLLDVHAIKSSYPKVIAAASRIQQQQISTMPGGNLRLTFLADGIQDTQNVIRVVSHASIAGVTVDGGALPMASFGSDGTTAWLKFINHAAPRSVSVTFAK